MYTTVTMAFSYLSLYLNTNVDLVINLIRHHNTSKNSLDFLPEAFSQALSEKLDGRRLRFNEVDYTNEDAMRGIQQNTYPTWVLTGPFASSRIQDHNGLSDVDLMNLSELSSKYRTLDARPVYVF